MNQDLHVVLGATGSLGAALVRHLGLAGRPVRAVARDAQRARALLAGRVPAGAAAQVEFEAADATDRAATVHACRSAGVVHLCVNAPYPQWPQVMPAAVESALAGAREAGARLVFPGNVYGYGRFQKVPASEDHPRAATTTKGRLRNTLERWLSEADRAGEVRVAIARMPDFFGPNVVHAGIAPIFEAALAGRRARWLGRLDVPHDMLFIDDAAAACALLAGSDRAFGRVWHVPGAGPVTGRQFIGIVFAAAGARPRAGALGRPMVRLAALFSPLVREVVEMLYLWEEPQVLDGSRFAAAFPEFRFTPHEEAARRTLEWFRARRA
ncbi:MAG TPA: NAD-dependent epimerase/dehydratase family protein [Candidatus Saccharimonadales bacterium]|nr:NAD-dependent epimerase/dehydratase family protein [Candidatus Saccharimonadales bacterium]